MEQSRDSGAKKKMPRVATDGPKVAGGGLAAVSQPPRTRALLSTLLSCAYEKRKKRKEGEAELHRHPQTLKSRISKILRIRYYSQLRLVEDSKLIKVGTILELLLEERLNTLKKLGRQFQRGFSPRVLTLDERAGVAPAGPVRFAHQ